MDAGLYLGGVWLVDFEFHPLTGREGNTPRPVCMVAREYFSGLTLRIGQEELLTLRQAPFPVDDSALFVAYYASAEFGCFLALGWRLPHNILDLFCEFRTHTNGRVLKSGNSLLGALTYHGLGGIEASEKDRMRDMVLQGGPWTGDEQQDILDYCESDVIALASLLPAMEDRIDWPRALLRGQYTAAAAHVEYNGIPLDMDTLNILRARWEDIKDNLIAVIDEDYGVYQGVPLSKVASGNT
jgi:DNA polymerase I